MNNRILNIFCDASIDRINHENRYNGSAGCILVDTSRAEIYMNNGILYDSSVVVDKDILYIPNATNNESEITAILLGVRKAIQYKDNYDIINLFSDSKICIYGLREWIFNWKIGNEKYYGSASTPIANQSIFIDIINLICLTDLKINLYHQKGHFVEGKIDSVTLAGKVFRDSNYIQLSTADIYFISKYNNMIDNETRKLLYGDNRVFALETPFSFNTNAINLEDYDKHINHSATQNLLLNGK